MSAKAEAGKWRPRENAEANEVDQAEDADLPAADDVMLQRDEWWCQKCGSLESLQIHQMIKRSQLGNDSLDNLVILCAYCHMVEHGQRSHTIPAVKACSKPKPRRK